MATDSFHLDPTGFPMMWVPEVAQFVHCLPVTKLQFERFLGDARDGHFSAAWYDEVLRLNPRVPARRIWRDNYWGALLTGVLPAEAERFAAWCGDGYRMPLATEWQRIYRALSARGASRLGDLGALAQLGGRQRELVENLERSVEEVCHASGAACGLPERLLLRLGVVEWVALTERGDKRWAGLGEPHPAFCGNLFAPDDGQLVAPADPERERLASFGFRLVFSPGTTDGSTGQTGPAVH
ncbi:MAG TPA: hypothetical protein VHB47_17075 [Thermoanaerobaculia bacterium]|jgi:hypothetical protein|nr:hypothetical protein [Thermoanaerobaculia bacterium]